MKFHYNGGHSFSLFLFSGRIFFSHPTSQNFLARLFAVESSRRALVWGCSSFPKRGEGLFGDSPRNQKKNRLLGKGFWGAKQSLVSDVTVGPACEALPDPAIPLLKTDGSFAHVQPCYCSRTPLPEGLNHEIGDE